LGIATRAELDRSPFLGALFEGYVAAEILKTRALAPAVEALDVRAFVDDLNRGSGRSAKTAVRRPRKAK